MKKSVLRLAVPAVLFAGIALAGCAREDERAAGAREPEDSAPAWVIPTGGFPDVNPLEVRGDIIVAGSSTVFPLAEAMAERFRDEGYSGNITIDSIGSGGGFERFCVAGESDISNASRPIKEGEVEDCRSVGREPIEIRVGTDALAVVVNPANDWVSDATIEEIAQIFTADNWSDVDPSWPNRPILRFIPGTDSGTFDYFVEEVFDEDEEPILSARNTQLSEDDNVLVQGIEGSADSVGFFGYAYYANEGDALKILDIDEVTASAESVDAGTYPLARPLFMYTAPNVIASRPQAAAFLAFVLNYVNEEIDEVGYFPANPAALNAAKDAWMDAMADQM